MGRITLEGGAMAPMAEAVFRLGTFGPPEEREDGEVTLLGILPVLVSQQ